MYKYFFWSFFILLLFFISNCESASSDEEKKDEKKKSYQITFHLTVDSETKTFPVSVEEGAKFSKEQLEKLQKEFIDKNTKKGYSIRNWYENKNFSGERLTLENVQNIAVTEDKNFYAKLEINQYTITFNTHGGSAVPNETANHGGTVTKPADPTKTGTAFEGWYKESTYENSFDFSAETITEAITLHAKWRVIIPLKQRDTTKEFTFTENSNPWGATYHDGHLYVTGHWKRFIYAYRNGVNVPSKDLKGFDYAPNGLGGAGGMDLTGLTFGNSVFYTLYKNPDASRNVNITAINPDGTINTDKTFIPANFGMPAYYDGTVYLLASAKVYAYNAITKEADTSKDFNIAAPDDRSSNYGAYTIFQHFLYIIYNKSGAAFAARCYNLKTKTRDTSREFAISRTDWGGVKSAQGLAYHDGYFYLVSRDSDANNSKVFVFGTGH